MLTIQNLLKSVYCFIKNISKKSYRNCAVLVSGFSVFAMVSLNAHGFGGAGKNRSVACSSMKGTEGEAPAENQEQESVAALGDFASSCKQAIESEQSRIKEAREAEIKKREVTAVCASVEPVHNEVQKPPVNPYGDISISEEDYEALLRIVQAEAGGEDEQGKILVAEVILNRVLAEEFASTVSDVIFEKSG